MVKVICQVVPASRFFNATSYIKVGSGKSGPNRDQEIPADLEEQSRKSKPHLASRGNCHCLGATILSENRYRRLPIVRLPYTVVQTVEGKHTMSVRFKPVMLLLAAALLSLAAHPRAARAAGKEPPPQRRSANTALYIANVGDGSVMRCDGINGTPLNILGMENGMNPIGLAFGPDHNLYVTSYGEGCVRRFNPFTGASLGAFIPKGSGGMSAPITMAFGPDHNLYVVTGGFGDIRRYNGKTGAPMGLFIPHGRGGLLYPGDITFGRDGNLYVTNNFANSILRFNGKTGAWLGSVVKPGSGGLKNPQNIAFSPEGDLYAGGDSGVLQFNGKTGDFVRAFAAPDTHLGNVGGLTFGPDGDLYVGDWEKNDVVRYDRRTAAFKGVFVTPKSGLMENRYILFGPRGSGGASPAVAAAARAARLKAMRAVRVTRVAPMATAPAAPVLLAVGSQAPDFTVQDKAGSPVNLADYRGKVVVLDFWATWCGPCQASLPHTSEVAKQFADKGVVVLAVNVWDSKAKFDAWLPLHPEYASLTFVLDPTQEQGKDVASLLYHVSGIPTQYVIGKDGKVFKSFVGYSGSTTELADTLTQAIAAPSALITAVPATP